MLRRLKRRQKYEQSTVLIVRSFYSLCSSFTYNFFIQTLLEELEESGRALSELDVAVQEFGEQNPLLAKQLSFSLSKLHELHAQTSRLAAEKNTCLQKVRASESAPRSPNVKS